MKTAGVPPLSGDLLARIKGVRKKFAQDVGFLPPAVHIRDNLLLPPNGYRITLHDVGLFSDGTAVKQVGKETFRLAQEFVDDYVVVTTDEVCAAIKDVFQDTRSVIEPAGAMGVAAIKQYVAQHKLKGQTFVAVTCGANMNFDRLRFVAERAEFGEQREALALGPVRRCHSSSPVDANCTPAARISASTCSMAKLAPLTMRTLMGAPPDATRRAAHSPSSSDTACESGRYAWSTMPADRP